MMEVILSVDGEPAHSLSVTNKDQAKKYAKHLAAGLLQTIIDDCEKYVKIEIKGLPAMGESYNK